MKIELSSNPLFDGKSLFSKEDCEVIYRALCISHDVESDYLETHKILSNDERSDIKESISAYELLISELEESYGFYTSE